MPGEFLHQGVFAQLTDTERSLYFLLVLAGDRNGVSFYTHDRIIEHATASKEFRTVLSMLWVAEPVAGPLGMAA